MSGPWTQKGSRPESCEWGIHLTQVATRCCGRAKASTKKRIPRLLLWRGVGLRSASDSRSCRPKAATAMNSRVGRLGGHSHDARNLTFLFRSREATTHRVYLNEVDTPLVRIYTLRGFESVLAGSVQVSTGTKTSLSFQDGPVFTRVHRREGPAAPRGSRARTHGTTISQPTWPGVSDRLHPAHGAGAGPATFRDPRGPRGLCGNGAECESPRSRSRRAGSARSRTSARSLPA